MSLPVSRALAFAAMIIGAPTLGAACAGSAPPAPAPAAPIPVPDAPPPSPSASASAVAVAPTPPPKPEADKPLACPADMVLVEIGRAHV